MRKIFTLFLAIGLCSSAVNAVNYLPEPTATSPTNGAYVGNAGDLTAEWAGTRLTPTMEGYTENDLGSAIQRKITDGYKYVSISLNGEALDLESDFMFELYINDVSEQSGKWTGTISMYAPFALFTWSSGDVVEVHINEGIAQDATGNVNPAIDFSFTHYDLNYANVTFDPAKGSASFVQGQGGSFTATWKNETAVSINRKLATPAIFVTGTETSQVNITSQCSITDEGALKVDVPPLQAGTYNLCISEGAILFADDTINEENVAYSFTITGTGAVYPTGTVTPVNESTLETLEAASKVVYNWEGVEITINEKGENPIEVYINEELIENGYEAYLTQDGVKTDSETGNGLVVDLSGMDLQGGVYKVVLPTGYVLVSAKEGEGQLWNDEIATTYTVLVAPNPVINPSTGAQYKTSDNLANVTVNWPGCYFKINTGTPSLSIDGEPYEGQLDVTYDWTMEEVEDYDGNLLSINLGNIELVPGTYTLTLPAGYVSLAGPYGEDVTVESSVVEVSYTVISQYLASQAEQIDDEVSLEDPNSAIELRWPEEVSFVNAAEVSLSLKYNDEVVGTLTAQDINLVPGSSSEPDIMTMADATDRGNTMFLLVGASQLITQKGNYVIEIPEGFVENSLGQVNTSQEVTFLSTVLEVGEVAPAEGTSFTRRVDEVTFTITFEDAQNVIANASNPDAPVMVYSTDTEETYNEEFGWDDTEVLSIENNSVVINLGKELQAGTYYLSLREAAVIVDGMKNDGVYDYSFTVVNPLPGVLEEDPVVTPDPASENLTELTTITLSWEDYTISLNEDNSESATFNAEDVEGEVDENTLVFTVKADEAGTYTLTIPAEYVVATDEDDFEYYNEPITITYTLVASSSDEPTGDGDDTDSVSTLKVDSDSIIYNLDGVRISGKNLHKGIYIINGKKVAVK